MSLSQSFSLWLSLTLSGSLHLFVSLRLGLSPPPPSSPTRSLPQSRFQSVIHSNYIWIHTRYVCLYRDSKGNTLLHHACMQNKKKVAKSVLRLGANINAQNLQVACGSHTSILGSVPGQSLYLRNKDAQSAVYVGAVWWRYSHLAVDHMSVGK